MQNNGNGNALRSATHTLPNFGNALPWAVRVPLVQPHLVEEHLGREDADVEATAHLPPNRYAVRLIADEHDDFELRAPPAKRVRSALPHGADAKRPPLRSPAPRRPL